MKNLIRMICFTLAVMLLAGPALGNEAHAAGYTISGTVTTGGSEKDMIKVELLSGNEVVVQTQAAAQKITYTFSGVAPGTYTLRVSKAGHDTYTATVVVSNADVVKNVNMGQEGYTISGHITSSGSESEQLTVKLLSGIKVVKTLSVSGTYVGYSFTGIAPGEYFLEVSKPGHNTSKTSVTVRNADVTKDVALTAASSDTYTISGTISCHGNPNATIYLKLYKGNILLKSMTFTGNSAKYSISDLPSGTYRLLVTKEGFDDYESMVVVNGRDTSKNVPMFKIQGDPTATVSGRISGMSGAEDVHISLFVPGKQTPAYETRRNGNGSFSISNVAYGTYTVKVVANGHQDYIATIEVTGDTAHNIALKAEQAKHTCSDYQLSSDGTHHWYVCVECQLEKEGSRSAHAGGAATCQSKAACETCNALYGETGDHTPNIPAPTETEDQVCTLCGQVMAPAVKPDEPDEPSLPTAPSGNTEPTAPSGAPSGDGGPKGLQWWHIALMAVAGLALAAGAVAVIVKKKR
jgi:hypothetical protein